MSHVFQFLLMNTAGRRCIKNFDFRGPVHFYFAGAFLFQKLPWPNKKCTGPRHMAVVPNIVSTKAFPLTYITPCTKFLKLAPLGHSLAQSD